MLIQEFHQRKYVTMSAEQDYKKLKEQQRETRRGVFQDTLSFINTLHPSWKKIKSEYINDFDLTAPTTKNKTTVKVVNMDCVEAAKLLTQQGKTCMLNMASSIHRGGGVVNGAMAQEEELCRRSNLYHALKQRFYPFDKTDFLYTKNVKFFKDSDYNYFPHFNCDIITVAALNLNPNAREIKTFGKVEKYKELTDEKIRQILYYPATKGAENLVLSAFGCGAFQNNPIFISRMFRKYLKDLPYKNIYFAILDDHNSKANGFSNFLTFQDTFKKLL